MVTGFHIVWSSRRTGYKTSVSAQYFSPKQWITLNLFGLIYAYIFCKLILIQIPHAELNEDHGHVNEHLCMAGMVDSSLHLT